MVGDRLVHERKSNPGCLAPWRFFASVAAMAAFWGLLLLIAWQGKPPLILAILMVYAGPFAAVSLLAILISLPLLSAVIRLPITLALMLTVVCVITVYFEVYRSDELPLWLALVAVQFTLVAIASLMVIRISDFRPQRSRHFSLLTLILMVTIVCVALGMARAVAAALEIGFTDFADSRWASYLTVALLNSTAAVGPLMALGPGRIRFRVLLLVMGVPQASLLAAAIVGLHDWVMPNERVMNYTEAGIIVGIQAIAVSLSMLPIVLAPRMKGMNTIVEPPSTGVLQQEP